MLLLVVGLLVLVYLFSPPHMEIPPSAAFSQQDDQRLPVAGVLPVSASDPEIFTTGHSIRDKMLGLIKGANESILINSFLITNSHSSSQIVSALAERQANGVRVHVLSDSSSRFMPAGSLFNELTRAQIPWAEFNPFLKFTWPRGAKLMERDHRKVWIIDGRTIFLGGANITGESLGQPGHYGNIDFMVAFESPDAARSLIENFVYTWNDSSTDSIRVEDFSIPEKQPLHAEAWVFDQQLDGQEPIIGSMFSSLFATARREIWLLHAYTFTSPPLLRMIKNASERDVEVNLILPKYTINPRFTYAAHYGIQDIQEAGGRVWMHQSETLPAHFKGAIVDNQWTSIGSANFNYRSFALSREIAVVFSDPELARQLMSTVQDLKRDSQLVSPGEARSYRTFRHWFWWSLLQRGG